MSHIVYIFVPIIIIITRYLILIITIIRCFCLIYIRLSKDRMLLIFIGFCFYIFLTHLSYYSVAVKKHKKKTILTK